jgi:subtilisin
MSKHLAFAVAALAVVAAVFPAASSANDGRVIPGQFIVVLKDGADLGAAKADHRRSARAQVLHSYGHAVKGYAARLSDAGLAEVRADERVAFVTPDREGTPIEAQRLEPGINRIDADLSSALSSDGTGTVDASVAVYDTGVDTTHPDLNVAGGVNCLSSTDTYNNGTYDDEHGHGSHVGGILAAEDDSDGVVGVAPGARIWSVRVLNRLGSGTASSQLCGIDWITANAATHGIKVVNSSMALFGKPDDGNCGYSAGDVLHQAICRSVAAGITWVFAAGNTSGDFKGVAGASYNEVLTTTAMSDSDGVPGGRGPAITCRKGETDDYFASFSKYAGLADDYSHTIAGPGTCVYSTWKDGGYSTQSGTSMAAPHVAGTTTLCVLSGQCTGAPADIIRKMRGDADAYNRANTGYGFVGDPLRPVKDNKTKVTKYYGFLARAAGY